MPKPDKNLSDYFKKAHGDEGNIFVEDWFEKSKQIKSELCVQKIAVDGLAIQQRPVRSEKDNCNEDEYDKYKYMFKVSFVYTIFDVVLSKLRERFDYLTELDYLFGFSFDLHSTHISLDHCQRIEKALTCTKADEKDLSAVHLFDEIKSFQAFIGNDGEKSPLA